MTNKRYVPVFIDAKPAENLEPSTKETLCFVGILSSSMDGVPKLKGYKKTKRSRKIDAAKRIIDHLHSKVIEIDAIGLASKSNGQFIHWACDAINRSRKALGAEWELNGSTPTYLKWKGNRIPRSTVMGLSAYASILPIIGLRAEILAQGDPTKVFKLCLDALPNNSTLGMELIQALGHEPQIAQAWKENMDRGVKFEVGMFSKWKDTKGKWHPGKKHPNSILVDWFAASCLANVNPGQLQREGCYSENEIETIASIWEATFCPSSTTIINLDDDELQRRVSEYVKKSK